MLSIASNSASLRIQENLGRVLRSEQSAVQKLSSGLRINQASDDAAGLAISEKLRSKQRSWAQAQRNVNDAISMCQVADGALDEMGNMVIRLKELAIQAANGTLGAAERSALDQEKIELLAEIDRIAATTSYNGRHLLNGSGGDGTDLAVFCSSPANAMTVLSNDSQGNYSAGATSALGGGAATSYGLADLDGDGDTDLLVTQTAAGTVQVLSNDGQGNFQLASTIAAPGAGQIATADLDGDGDLDAVVTTSTGIAVLRNGGGSLSVDSTTAAVGPSQALSLDDVDGDGDLDALLVDSTGNSISTLRNDGTGHFTAAAMGSVYPGSQGLATGDVDGDGRVDAAVVDPFCGTVDVYKNSGTGVFINDWWASITGHSSGDLTMTDVDGDGDQDILVTREVVGGGVDVLKNDGTGNFTPASTVANAATGSTPSGGITHVDFDHDGDQDFAVSNSGGADPGVYFYRNDGTGAFTYLSRVPLSGPSAISSASQCISSGDVSIQAGVDSGAASRIEVQQSNVGTRALGIADISFLTASDALQSLELLDRSVSTIARQRGNWGTAQSRLDAAMRTNASMVETCATAASRIRDADIAQVTGDLSRNQILAEAGCAVLAQANQMPQLALRLIS